MMEKWTLIRDDHRYAPSERQLKENPPKICIEGTLKQAEHIAERLSLHEAGCDYYYYVEEIETLSE